MKGHSQFNRSFLTLNLMMTVLILIVFASIPTTFVTGMKPSWSTKSGPSNNEMHSNNLQSPFRSLQQEEVDIQQQQQQQQQQGDEQQHQNQYQALNDITLREAVHNWVTKTNKDDVIATYGPISQWDTQYVTDMSYLFTHARFFNDDLSQWNTSQVTDMSYVFAFASSFRGAAAGPDDDVSYTLRKWDVSKVRDMKFAFHHASAFEGDGIVDWDVSSVTDLTYFAQGTSNFNQNIWRWDTRNVRSFNRAFHNATRFQQSLCWHLHPQAVAIQTFCGTDGAKFECDPDRVLQNPINAHYHTCCDCEYSADEHYYGYHFDDDTFWDDDGNDHDKQLGIILSSCIWAMVFIMIVLVGYVTLRRRHEVGEWIQSKLQSSSHTANGTDSHIAPDGGAIATLVGPADNITINSTSTRTPSPEITMDNNNNNDNDEDTMAESFNIPMLVGADNVQYENRAETAIDTSPRDATSILATVVPLEQTQNVALARTAPATKHRIQKNGEEERATIVDLPAFALDILNPRNEYVINRNQAEDSSFYV